MGQESSPFTQVPQDVSNEMKAALADSPTTAGDSSFLDNLDTRDVLIKGGQVAQAIITKLELRQTSSEQPFFSITGQLYGTGIAGKKLIFENSTEVPHGKRWNQTIFLEAGAPKADDTAEKVANRERMVQVDKKNLLAALLNIPRAKLLEEYRKLPDNKKLKHAKDLAPFLPTEQWVQAKVLVEIRIRKDANGERRNDYHLHAASTQKVS